MRNKLLHALSNRKTFEDPIFNGDPEFMPKELSAEEQQLRKLFCLDQITDYYVRVYLSLLAAYPDIVANVDDTPRTYSVLDFPPRGVVISGGELMAQQGVFGYFTDPAQTVLPIDLTYEIGYIQGGTAVRIVARETGRGWSTNAFTTGTDPNKILRVEWPEEVPFVGPIKLNQSWISGAKVVIQVQPSQFPYAHLAKQISGSAYLMRLLADNKLVDEFVETADHQRKVAIALLLLARDNTSAYPDPTEVTLITTESDTEVEVVDETFIGAAIGDYGENNATELAVSQLVKSWNPSWIITQGDNWYGSSTGSLDLRVGQYYGDYIYPYKGSYGYNTAAPNRFWIVPGNHDRSPMTRVPVFVDYFSMPTQVYYDVVLPGNVHALMVDSGYDTGGVQRQPDGVDINSRQADFFRGVLQRSKARWRLASFHHPVLTSSTGHQETPELDWDWDALRVPLILNGHNHVYERLKRNSVTHVTNGMGGSNNYSFDPVLSPYSLVRYNSGHGAMRFTINSKQFVAEFINTAGQTIDRFVLK